MPHNRILSYSTEEPINKINGHALQSTAQKDMLLDSLTSTPMLILGSVLALVSAGGAIRNAPLDSTDFQWSGTHLLLQHRDPWSVFLSGDVHHEIILLQFPNYLHELYVLLLPFGSLPFPKAALLWGICNVLLVLVLIRNVSRLFELDAPKTWLLFILVLISSPFRWSVGAGQSNILALTAVSFWAVVGSQTSRGQWLGIAYEKYSIPPVLVVALLLRRRWKLVLSSLLSPVLGVLFVAAWLGKNLGVLALEPFRTAFHKGAIVHGTGNITEITEQLLRHYIFLPAWIAILPSGIAILLAFAMGAYFAFDSPSTDGRIIFACTLVASLICFPHLSYDWLKLIFSVAIALKSEPGAVRNIALVLLAYFWYLYGIPHAFHRNLHHSLLFVDFSLLLCLVSATYSLRNRVKWTMAWQI